MLKRLRVLVIRHFDMRRYSFTLILYCYPKFVIRRLKTTVIVGLITDIEFFAFMSLFIGPRCASFSIFALF